MNLMKKFVALTLSVLMLMGGSSLAFAAAGSDGSITIDNAVSGQDYTIYRIFDLESFSKDTAYSYKVNANWADFINQNNIKNTYVEINDAGYVTWKDGASAAEFAALAKAYADENNVANQGSKTAEGTSVSFTGLGLGYYLVDSSLGFLCSLDTTDKDVTVNEKNSESTIDKQVKEGDIWGETSSAKIGDTVEYRSIITIGDGAQNVVMHDVMEAGLTFNKGSVTVTDKNGTASGEAFQVIEANDGCTFEVEFSDVYISRFSRGDTLTVAYTAVLNENAEISPETNDNKAKLTFGEKSSTEWDTTETSTFKFDMVKTDADGKIITGAVFHLWDSENGGSVVPVKEVSADDEKGIYVYQVMTEAEANGGNGVDIKAGKATVIGIDIAKYYLNEDTAPDGYNILTARVEVNIDGNKEATTISEDGSIYGTYKEGGVQIINRAGSALPSTGGMGTKIFYLLGSVLVIAAVIIFIARRRMHIRG